MPEDQEQQQPGIMAEFYAFMTLKAKEDVQKLEDLMNKLKEGGVEEHVLQAAYQAEIYKNIMTNFVIYMEMQDVKNNQPKEGENPEDPKIKKKYSLFHTVHNYGQNLETKDIDLNNITVIEDQFSFKDVHMSVEFAIYFPLEGTQRVRKLTVRRINFLTENVTYHYCIFEFIPKLVASMNEENREMFTAVIQTMLEQLPEFFKKHPDRAVSKKDEEIMKEPTYVEITSAQEKIKFNAEPILEDEQKHIMAERKITFKDDPTLLSDMDELRIQDIQIFQQSKQM